MITLKSKQEIIISYFLNGTSQREIERQTGISRKTIRKYIKEYEEGRQKLLVEGKAIEKEELVQSIVEKPKYDTSSRKKVKLTDEIIGKLKQYVKENEEKVMMGMGKQQKKKIDIYESLQNQGYEIGYTTVCNALSKRKRKKKHT